MVDTEREVWITGYAVARLLGVTKQAVYASDHLRKQLGARVASGRTLYPRSRVLEYAAERARIAAAIANVERDIASERKEPRS